jgi:hypothetical protein
MQQNIDISSSSKINSFIQAAFSNIYSQFGHFKSSSYLSAFTEYWHDPRRGSSSFCKQCNSIQWILASYDLCDLVDFLYPLHFTGVIKSSILWGDGNVEMMMASSHHSITQLSFLLQPKEFWGINCTNNTKLSATKVVFLGNIYIVLCCVIVFSIFRRNIA